MTGTFFFSFTPDPAIYVVYGALISYERQARQGSGTFTGQKTVEHKFPAGYRGLP